MSNMNCDQSQIGRVRLSVRSHVDDEDTRMFRYFTGHTETFCSSKQDGSAGVHATDHGLGVGDSFPQHP